MRSRFILTFIFKYDISGNQIQSNNKNARLASHLYYYDLKTEHVAIQF